MHPLRGRCHDPQPLLVELPRVEADRVGDHDHLRVLRAVGIETEAAGTAGDDQPHIAIDELIGGQRVVHRLRDNILRQWNLQADCAGAGPEPVEVGVKPEDPAGVAPQALEHTVSVEQAMVEDADLGLFLRHKTVVHEDDPRHDRSRGLGGLGWYQEVNKKSGSEYEIEK